MEGAARVDDLDDELAAGLTGRDLGPAGVEVDRLVLDLVVLEAQRLARADEEHLSAVAVGERVVDLVAPGLLDALHRYLERGRVAHGAWSQSGLAATYSSAVRRSFGVFTVSQTPWCR